MQVLIYGLFASLFVLPYLSTLGLVPRQVTWLMDLISAAVLMVVILRLTARKPVSIGIIYWPVLILICLNMTFGVVLNAVSPGTLFAALRDNFKFLPLFFLPVFYSFSQAQLHKQLLLLLGLTLMQLPVALYQRLFQFSDLLTGDVVTGTLKGSGVLTIYLLAAVSLLTGFYIRKRLSAPFYYVALAAIFLPTTINETKVTVFVLPIALIVPILFMEGGRGKVRRLLGVLLLGAGLLAVFVPIYDHFMEERRPDEGLQDFLTEEGRLEGYLKSTGRAQTPFVLWSVDPTKFMLGLGIGNVSESFLGPRFTGEYFREYGELARTTLNHWQLEIGLLGVILMLVFFSLVFRDTLYLKRGNDLTAAFALGWIGVMAVLTMSLVYDKSVRSDEVGYLLWYFSGCVAATAARRRREEKIEGKAKDTEIFRDGELENRDL